MRRNGQFALHQFRIANDRHAKPAVIAPQYLHPLSLHLTDITTAGASWLPAIADCLLRSIQQRVQNGQFLSGLAKNVSNLLVAPHANKRIERLLVYVIVPTLSIDQTPTLQPVEPSYDGSAGHAHIGSKLGDREGLAFNIAKRHA